MAEVSTIASALTADCMRVAARLVPTTIIGSAMPRIAVIALNRDPFASSESVAYPARAKALRLRINELLRDWVISPSDSMPRFPFPPGIKMMEPRGFPAGRSREALVPSAGRISAEKLVLENKKTNNIKIFLITDPQNPYLSNVLGCLLSSDLRNKRPLPDSRLPCCQMVQTALRRQVSSRHV